MKRAAKVIELSGDEALVEVIFNEEACKGCSGFTMCKASCAGTRLKAKCGVSDIEAGDMVEIEMSDAHSLRFSFYLYIMPIIMFFIGVGIATYLNKSQNTAMLVGAGLLVLTYALLFIFDKLIKRSPKYAPEIVGLIKKSSSL